MGQAVSRRRNTHKEQGDLLAFLSGETLRQNLVWSALEPRPGVKHFRTGILEFTYILQWTAGQKYPELLVITQSRMVAIFGPVVSHLWEAVALASKTQEQDLQQDADLLLAATGQLLGCYHN